MNSPIAEAVPPDRDIENGQALFMCWDRIVSDVQSRRKFVALRGKTHACIVNPLKSKSAAESFN